ncbi:phage neck terminator protein [Secundilactobacillus kimchicus]|uniref:phage neck terminator protein n=1 Tax=Secundilactobacillus kimchicus TaxID=528209 RepID=UPI0024A98429|nr:hypothetical protein [Secundilactobacillus kimchicus]
MINGVYHRTIKAIVDEIHKYKPDWTITKDFLPDNRPKLPYFYYELPIDYERLTFNDVENEPFALHLQITAVAEDNLDAHELSHDMRMLLRSLGLLADLRGQGISIVTVDSMAETPNNFGVAVETEAKLELVVVANDNYDDTTQEGYIKGADFSTEINSKEI